MHVSVTYLLARARQLEVSHPEDEAEAAWLISGQRVLAGWGLASEEDWPGPPPSYQNWPAEEPPGIDAKAKANRIHSYQRVRTAEQCYRVLSRRGCVQIGLEITEQWFDAPGGVIVLPESRDAIIGNHSVCILGYAREKDGFEFVNSWGRAWGDGGFGILPVEYFDQYFTEAWANSSLGLMPTPHHFGTQVLRWESPDLVYEGMKQFGVEIRDTSRDERIGWAFAVLREGHLDVEELFVKPEHRRRGYGRQLAENLKQLSWHVGRSVRLWVPFADYELSNLPALARIAEILGVEFGESGVRWAALKAVASQSASRLFVPPPIGRGEGRTVDIPQISLPKRPAMPRPRAPALAAAAVAASLAAGTSPTQDTHVPGEPATATAATAATGVISEDDFQSISSHKLREYAPLYERFAAREDATKSDSSDIAAAIPDDVFEAAAKTVFKKYADLYQRLA